MDTAAHKKTVERMEATLEHLKRELAGLRTGRASLALLDNVRVDYYGTHTPLKQVANLAVPESRLITVQPWEAAQIKEIEKAIVNAGLGITPSNDGKIIRLPIPPLTEERRKDLIKVCKKYGEETKVKLRAVRHETNDDLKNAKLSEDDLRKAQTDIQKLTDQYTAKIDEALKKKEHEIMEV
ncbi:MAG: ribosome recycling factor [Nitrospira sp.]|nr:ribosome recycling factor [Nitrospira sp.]